MDEAMRKMIIEQLGIDLDSDDVDVHVEVMGTEQWAPARLSLDQTKAIAEALEMAYQGWDPTRNPIAPIAQATSHENEIMVALTILNETEEQAEGKWAFHLYLDSNARWYHFAPDEDGNMTDVKVAVTIRPGPGILFGRPSMLKIDFGDVIE